MSDGRPLPPPFAGDPAAEWCEDQSADYNPMHDPRFLSDVVTAVLHANGEWCHPGRIILEERGGVCDPHLLADYTYYAIQQGRRVGLVIEGDQVRGYRFLRFEYVTYVRPHRELCWPPCGPTQLTIAGVVS